MKLWLDDQRTPPKGWEWCASPIHFADKLHRFVYAEEISFDHDLGECADGYECAKLLIQYCVVVGIRVPKLLCHSQNPIGKERLERLFEEASGI